MTVPYSVADWIEDSCRFSKGKWYGQQFHLEPWQRTILTDLVHTLNDDGMRRYRTAYVSVPRKNGKTEMMAALALYWLFVAGEPGSEIYSVAGDADQAGIAFSAARRMIEQNPAMEAVCKVYRRSIVRPDTGAHYKVLSSDHAGKHGYSPDLVIFDELHVQTGRDLWDVMRTGMGARQQPLLASITTAGIFDRTSIAFEVYDYATKVRDGIIEDKSFYTAIWEADKDAEWTDPKVWRASNPNLGVSVSESFLEQECAVAKETPSFQNTYRRLYLNQWTEQEVRFLDMHQYDACDGEAKLVPGAPTWAGLDLSTTTDISALVLVQRTDGGGYVVEPHFWIPAESIIRRSRKDKVPYDAWKRDGYVTATPGNVIDYEFIRKRINELSKKYMMVGIAYDNWNATSTALQLKADGREMREFGQGFADMNEPTKELERLVIDGNIRHGGNPVLRWMASNVTVRHDAAENIRPDKLKSTDRIDGLVALIMAIGLEMVHSRLHSRYETEDLTFV